MHIHILPPNTHIQGEYYVMIKAEVRAMQQKPKNAKDSSKSPVAGERHRTASPSHLSEGNNLANTLISNF